jgi:hypothetical protein
MDAVITSSFQLAVNTLFANVFVIGELWLKALIEARTIRQRCLAANVKSLSTGSHPLFFC